MGFNQITPVVKNLLIINIILFLGADFIMNAFGSSREMLYMYYYTNSYFQPYQVITHMFMHGSFTHLFFNMFALFMFGPILEMTWGPKRFLVYYFFTAAGAAILHTLVSYIELTYLGNTGIRNSAVVGASGAVFGLLLGYGVYYPNNIVQLLIPPIPMKAKYFVMLFAGIELFLGVGSFNTGIAHFAHLGGALFGLIMIWYWRSSGKH
ncbi:MAG: rhomboid family intramembrane serine protease [Saprospiraceae bacterium]